MALRLVVFVVLVGAVLLGCSLADGGREPVRAEPVAAASDAATPIAVDRPDGPRDIVLPSASPAADADGVPASSTEPGPRPSSRATRQPGATLIANGERDRRRVALTFDADMTTGMLAQLRRGTVRSWYDARIVNLLRSGDVPATIFVTGLWAQAYPEVVRELAADPRFELENHSFDHAAWRTPCYGLPTVATDDARRLEVTRAVDVLAPLAVTPRFFRYPGGCHAPSDLALVAGLGEQPVGWDVVSGDAFQADPNVIVRSVLRQVQPGSIVVMHCIGAPNAPATFDALTRLLPLLRADGYSFVTLRELLD